MTFCNMLDLIFNLEKRVMLKNSLKATCFLHKYANKHIKN